MESLGDLTISQETTPESTSSWSAVLFLRVTLSTVAFSTVSITEVPTTAEIISASASSHNISPINTKKGRQLNA